MMLIAVKVKMFYLVRKTKTVEFWCDPNENYKEWFDDKINKENNKIHRVVYLKSSFIFDKGELPHYRKVRI